MSHSLFVAQMSYIVAMSFIWSANATSYDGFSEQKVHVIALSYFISTGPKRLELAANLPTATHAGTLPTDA